MTSPLTPGHRPDADAQTTIGHTTTSGHVAHEATHHDVGSEQQFGDLKVSTGSQAAYVTLELILWLLVTVAIFVTAAVIDENESGQGFGASEAWFYVTLLTVGLFVSRGLAKIGQRGNDGTRTL